MNDWKRSFAIIWPSQFISILTSSIVGFSTVFWLSLETKSAQVLAFAVLSSFLPYVLLGLFAGVYIDRWNRKKIMILSDLFIAVCTLILFFVLLSGSMNLGYFYILFACRAIGGAFHSPSFQASIPLLAPESELTRIAGINQSIYSASNIVAPVAGAALIGFLDIKYILLLDVIGALVACTALLFVKIPNPVKKETQEHVWREIKECFTAVRATKGLSYLFICFMLVSLAIMPVAVLFPLITVNHFGGTSLQMGLIEMVWGAGALAGGLMIGLKKVKINKVLLINFSYLLLGFYLAMSGLLPADGFLWFLTLTVIGGVAMSVFNALFTAIIQYHIDPGVLGRVFSVFFSLTMLPSVVGIVASGFLAEELGITTVFLIGGIMICLVGIVSFFIPAVRHLGKMD